MNTLLLYIPLLALTDGMADGGTNTHRFAWAGGTFFPVVLLFQFFVLAGNRFWVYTLLMYLGYHTAVVLCWFFWFWREIVFGVTYVLSVQYSCAVVSVFLLWLFGVTYVLSVQYSCAVVSVFLLWWES